MTPHDLVILLEELLLDVSLGDIRQGFGPHGNLSDEGYVLLVRFMAGERPSVPAVGDQVPRPHVHESRHAGSPPPSDEQLSMLDELEAELERSERRNPDEPLVLGGEFDGVTLL